MDGEVIDPLLRLFDEGVAIDFPGEFFGPAADFFERLINRDGADGHGRIANDPFAGGVNVFAGGQIHHGVGAPFRCPTHLLDFFFDRRRHRAVADVGVDFHQEIAADDHRLGFRMIDVGGNDGAATRDLSPHEFWCYLSRDVGTERFAKVLLAQIVAGNWGSRIADRGISRSSAVFSVPHFAFRIPHFFPDRDVLHLRRNDSLTRVPKLGHDFAGLRPQSRQLGAWSLEFGASCPSLDRVSPYQIAVPFCCVLGVRNGQVAIINRLNFATFAFFDVAAFQHPIATQGRKPLN